MQETGLAIFQRESQFSQGEMGKESSRALVRAITESSHNEDAGRVFYAAGREPIYSVDSLRIVVRG